LNFFFKHVLKKQWDWGDIVKPKKVKSLPDVITYDQVVSTATLPEVKTPFFAHIT